MRAWVCNGRGWAKFSESLNKHVGQKQTGRTVAEPFQSVKGAVCPDGQLVSQPSGKIDHLNIKQSAAMMRIHDKMYSNSLNGKM